MLLKGKGLPCTSSTLLQDKPLPLSDRHHVWTQGVANLCELEGLIDPQELQASYLIR